MSRRLFSSLLLVVACALSLAVLVGGVFAPDAGAKDTVPRAPRADLSTILVRFSSPVVAKTRIRNAGDRTAGVTRNGVHIVKLARGRTAKQGVAAYRRRAGVVYAELNYVRTTQVAAPNDPSYGDQWGLSAVDAVDGWTIVPGSYSSGVGPSVAVVDTGVDSTHPDLAANVDTSKGANCLSGSCVAGAGLDDHGHGTHVAGIVGAVTNNGVGVAGLAFSSRVIPVKVLNNDGEGSDASIASGILWASSRGARVINLSLGGYGFSQTLCDAVASVTSAGAVVVAAAGNDGTSEPLYPAACTGAVGVAATAEDGTSPDWSNWDSPNVFLSAPGDAILSTHWTGAGDAYETFTGTSMATPYTAGLAALLLTQNPLRTPADVRRLLATSASKIGADLYPPFTYGTDPYGTCAGCTWHPYYGYGQIDARAALCLEAPASVSTYAPEAAATGGSVTLNGAAVGCATAVSLGFVGATFTVHSPTQITASVPSGVSYGRWRVTTGAGTAVDDLVFSVLEPEIGGFSPLSGRPGSTVTITGANFAGVTSVTLDTVPVTFSIDSSTQITATVPSGLTFGRWRVSSPFWTATDPLVFNVTGAASPFEVAPDHGAPGTSVALAGGKLNGATSVSLGFVNASFTVDAPGELTAIVPPGVSYGRWRVTTPRTTVVDDWVFSVPEPEVSGFSPLSGPASSTVTISGSNFGSVTSVSLADVEASFTVDSPTQITATVPGGPAYGRWRVASPTWTSTDTLVYTVTG